MRSGRGPGQPGPRHRSQGVPVYWIVNVKASQVEVHEGPGADGYSVCVKDKPGDSVPVVIEGAQVGRIAVSDILPLDPPAGGNGA